jgi:adenosylmethionine-8-amino-7-oxononanoate aminotransferase
MNAVTTDALWMPFTANRDFKQQPRVICGAEGHHYTTTDGRRLYDTFSGLWTSGVGHCHPKIVAAVQQQVATLDYAMVFQMGNDKSFALAERVVEMAPEGFSNVFFTNSGSESVDTALKIALAYHRAKGEGHRTRLIGREKGYHGVNFGGMSVGGIVPRPQCVQSRHARARRRAGRRSRTPVCPARRQQHRRRHRRTDCGFGRRHPATCRVPREAPRDL